MTTRQIALNTPRGCKIITMDVDPASVEASQLEIGDVDRHLAQKLGAFDVRIGGYFQNSPQAHKVRQLWGDTARLDPSPYAGRMDLVFIDAGHTYAYVKTDTANALKMLRPSGVILWHDYLQLLHPDVTQYLLELAVAGRRIYHLRGTSLALYRDPTGGGA